MNMKSNESKWQPTSHATASGAQLQWDPAEAGCVCQRVELAKARARHAAQRALMPSASRPGRHSVPLHHHQGQGPRCHQPQRPCRWCIHMTCMHLPKYILLLQFVFQFIYMAHACLSSVSCIRVMHACSDHFESVSCCGVQINDPHNRRFVSSCEICWSSVNSICVLYIFCCVIIHS